MTFPPEWFDGYRSHQQETIDEVVYHFDRGIPLVILDAPTGTGKTLIGESVRDKLETKGIYLCSSLTLQDQQARDFPYTKVLKGRSNYRPLQASGPYRSATCADCDKSKDEEGETLCTFCPSVRDCPYEVAKSQLMAADAGNSNIRYFLTEANNVKRLSGIPFAIVDECDVLESELMGFIEASVSSRMRKLLGLGMPKKKTVIESWVEWFERSIPIVQKRLEELAPTGDDNMFDKRKRQSVERVLANLKRVAPEIEKGEWVYTGYQNGDVTFRPVKVEKYGEEYLWRHAEKWLCMSATVISPEEFVQSLGYSGPWECVRMDSPFDKSRRLIHYVPVANMTFSERETEWPKMADGVRKVMDKHPNERVLVHTNSYMLSSFLEGRLNSSRVVTYLDRMDRAAAIAAFENMSDAVLLASSLSRGYDGTDDLCRVVVVCKVPFPDIGDRQINARLRSSGGGLWYGVQTARALVQSVGRGVRHEDDHCVIVVLDQQFKRFWDDWKKGVSKHRLLPNYFSEAIVWGGSYRNELLSNVRSYGN